MVAHPDGEKIYIGNYGWGPTEWNPQHGSISVFDSEGQVLSPSNGYTEGLSRVQGMAFDSNGHLWMASWGTQDPMPPTDSRFNFEGKRSAAVVYLDADPNQMRKHRFSNQHHLTFDVACDAEGNTYVSNSGYRGSKQRGIAEVASSVVKLRVEDGEIHELARWTSPEGNETFRQIMVGPDGNVYVVAVETSRVLCFDPDLSTYSTIENGVYGPWGIIFDSEGTMYVSNFGRETGVTSKEEAEKGPFGVSVLRGEPGAVPRLVTLPTGGKQVRLANGLPLYGNPESQADEDGDLACYNPIMRLTGSRIDSAGNLWACNNWKPSAVIDVFKGDPGGDGMVIFVGIAAPKR